MSFLELHDRSGRSNIGLLLGEGQAEPKDVAPVARRVLETIRRATIPRVAAPATTTVHAVRPTGWTSRIRL